MTRTIILPAAETAVLAFAQSHADTLQRSYCPALVAMAEECGRGWVRTLVKEIKAGTITHINGQEALVEIPDWPPKVQRRQEALL